LELFKKKFFKALSWKNGGIMCREIWKGRSRKNYVVGWLGKYGMSRSSCLRIT
jgi:hypothetical protein